MKPGDYHCDEVLGTLECLMLCYKDQEMTGLDLGGEPKSVRYTTPTTFDLGAVVAHFKNGGVMDDNGKYIRGLTTINLMGGDYEFIIAVPYDMVSKLLRSYRIRTKRIVSNLEPLVE